MKSLFKKLTDFTGVTKPALARRPRNAGRISSGPATTYGGGAGGSNYFEALQNSTDRTQLRIATINVGNYALSYTREYLARIARYLYDNHSLVSYAVNTIEQNSVPIWPQAASPDRERNKVYEEYFERWAKRADFTGRFDFCDLQRIACRSIDLDGDIAPIFTSENGFPQIQLIDGCRIGVHRDDINDPNYVDGIRVDNLGRISSYSVLVGENKYSAIPASEMLLLYDPDRYSSYRGLSALRRGMNDARDVSDIKGFEKKAVKIGSAMSAVIEGGPLEEDVWGEDTGTGGNAPALDANQQAKNISMAELLGGDILTLPNGQTLKQLSNLRADSNVLEFMDELAGYMVCGVDIPPAYFLDRELTGPNQRSVMKKAQRKFEKRQEKMCSFVEWAWIRVIGYGVANDGLPSGPGWDKATFQLPPKVSIDEGRDNASSREDVTVGLMTRQTRFGNAGQDWVRETDQSFDEDDYIFQRAKELQSKHPEVDLPIILQRYGYGNNNPLPVDPVQPDQTQPNQD